MGLSISEEPTYFAVIRHGDKVNGSDESSLTENGRLQAQIAGPALKEFLSYMFKINDIQLIASPLKRTEETATLMAETLNIKATEIQYDKRIRERNSLRNRLVDPREPADVIFQRMKEGIEEGLKIAATKKAIAVFVSHGGIEKQFRVSAGEQDPDYRHHLKTCEVTVYKRDGDKYTVLAILRPDFTTSTQG